MIEKEIERVAKTVRERGNVHNPFRRTTLETNLFTHSCEIF